MNIGNEPNAWTRSLLPCAAFLAVPALFFLRRGFRPLLPKLGTALRVTAALPLLASGTLHLVRPAVFLALIPPPFPQKPWLIILTGIPELLGAAGLLHPATRKPAALCLTVFLVAVFPANIHVAGQTIGGLPMPSVPVRWTMQAAYMLLILTGAWGLPGYKWRGTSRE